MRNIKRIVEIENMKRLIVLTISIIIFASTLVIHNAFSQEPGKVFFLDFTITKSNEVTLIGFDFGNGKSTSFIDEYANYTIKIIAVNGSTLFKEFVSISFRAEALPYPGQEEYEVEVNEIDKYLRLPFYREADRIELYFKDKVIFSLDVKPYFCNNDGVCSGYETEFNCPKDCRKTHEIPWLYIGIALILTAVLVVYLIRKNYTLKV